MQALGYGYPKRMAASGTICEKGGSINGFYCNVSGDLTISLGTATGGTAILVITGATAETWYPFPVKFSTGAYATIANSGDFTFSIV